MRGSRGGICGINSRVPDDDAQPPSDGPPPGPADVAAPPDRSEPGDAPPPDRSDPGGAPRPRTSRRLIAAAAVTAIAVGVIVIAARQVHRRGAATAGGAAASGAAIRAPEGPGLAAPGETGVRLTGFVVDGAGVAVLGAEVSAEQERGAADRALAPHGAAGSGTAAAGGGSAGGGSAPVTLAPPTAVDGRFVISGLSPGRYRLRVTGAGLVPAELRYVPVPSDEARIVVARQVAIEGSVTDGGKPVANAPVGLRSEAIGGTIESRSDATGRFHFGNLPEGRYQLFAWQGALAARTVRVSRLGAGPFGPIELRLEAAAIVVGRVIDRDEGTGLVAAIELRPSGDDQAPRYVRSGDDGVFRVEGVPTGKWIAEAFVPGYLGAGGIELEAGHGIPEIALGRGGAITGRVLDGDGHPVAGASVRALTAGQNAVELSAEVDRDKLRRFSGRTAAPVPATAPGTLDADPQFLARGELGVLVGPIPPIPPPGAHVAQVAIAVDPSLAGEPAPLPDDPARASIWITGSDGVYRIRGFAAGKVTVLAIAAGFAEARSRLVAVEPGQTLGGVDLVLNPGTILVGKVTDQHGAPVIGAQVTAAPAATGHGAAKGTTPGASAGATAGATPGATIDAFTDEAGEYKLGPVTGAIELRATAYGHGEARRTLELAAVRGATPAERREDLVLAVADAVFAGILEDVTGAPVSGAHLDVVGGVSDGRHAIVAPDGTFSIDLLPAGPLRLHIEHPAYPPEDIDAVAGSVNQPRARLRLALGGGVEGALLDAASGAPIASVTLAASGPSNALAEAATDKAGRWRLGPLRPGRWKIAIRQPGYLAQVRELDVPVAHAPGQTSVRDVRIDLARGALIGGTVRDARGQRVAAAHVVAAAASGATCEGDSDGRGEFRMHDCPTGDVTVGATKAAARGATRTTVRPGDEILSLALDLR